MTDAQNTRESTQGSERLHLSNQDRKAFLAALDNPPEPNEALRNAAQRHRRLKGD